VRFSFIAISVALLLVFKFFGISLSILLYVLLSTYLHYTRKS
jgi:hypothetical protein